VIIAAYWKDVLTLLTPHTDDDTHTGNIFDCTGYYSRYTSKGGVGYVGVPTESPVRVLLTRWWPLRLNA